MLFLKLHEFWMMLFYPIVYQLNSWICSLSSVGLELKLTQIYVFFLK